MFRTLRAAFRGRRRGAAQLAHAASLAICWCIASTASADPVLRYASYFGGNGEDNGGGVHVDATGITIGGLTTSSGLPGQLAPAGGFDSFVANFDPSGTTLQFAAYFGGSDADTERDIAVDAVGDVYLYGETTSADLPTTAGAFDRSCGGDGLCGGGDDTFVAKLSGADGALLWATYLGGSGSDVAGKIALDPDGNPIVSGYTNSADLPVTPGAYDRTCGTDGTCNESFEPDRVVRRDCFVAKLTSDGELVYATYLGGSGFDRCFGIDVDGSGRAVVVGSTLSADFPATEGAWDTECGGDGSCDGADDAFAAMLDPAGSALVYATFLGGSGNGDPAIEEYGWAVDVEDDGRASLVGQTDSSDFPTPGGVDTSFGGGTIDAFVASLDATGSSLTFASYLGGAGTDQALDVAADALGRLHVSGVTTSADLVQVAPLAGPSNACANCGLGFTEAFVTTIDPVEGSVLFSSFLGGSSSDYGSNLTVVDGDSADGAVLYLVGDAASEDFPVLDPFQAVHGMAPGGAPNYDAFLVVVPEADPALAGAIASALVGLLAQRRRR
jgi:hypothetical protein